MSGFHSFGSELRWCQLDGIRISETLMPAGLVLDRHAHNPGQLCFVLEGEYVEMIDGRATRLRPGRMQFRAPGEAHTNRFGHAEDVLTLLISFDPRRWFEPARRRPLTIEGLLKDASTSIREQLRSIDDASYAAIETWSLLSLSHLSRPNDTHVAKPVWLMDAELIIERRFNDKVSLTTIASAVGVHRATLAAAFRRHRGLSVGEAISSARIAFARDILARGRTPLAEIATQCGFHDQAHFSHVFRVLTGCTPSAFRRAVTRRSS